MDENTKHIVASNLTMAHCSTQVKKVSEDVVWAIYLRFIDKLNELEDQSQGEPLPPLLDVGPSIDDVIS